MVRFIATILLFSIGGAACSYALSHLADRQGKIKPEQRAELASVAALYGAAGGLVVAIKQRRKRQQSAKSDERISN
jgi:hypothetical protein